LLLLFLFDLQYWGLNPEPCTWQASTLQLVPLQPCPQPFFFLNWFLLVDIDCT
jgi:hypothetical protein